RDWSSDVCSSDLGPHARGGAAGGAGLRDQPARRDPVPGLAARTRRLRMRVAPTEPEEGSMSTVEIEQAAEHVAVVRLNRPDRLNAMDYTLVSELHDALDAVASDDDCRVVVLTGAGRAFCAGLDLRDFGEVPAVGAHRHRKAGTTGQAFLANLVQHIRDTPQIVVAA